MLLDVQLRRMGVEAARETGWAGEGQQCPNCNNQTLQAVHELGDGRMIRRCGICDFSGLDLAPEA